jgi:uncharacterized protein YeaO (DUF488 family)
MIVTKRAYEPFTPSDGYRVLVDRLWPRGVSKADAHLDAWEKAIAPSRALRQRYRHERAALGASGVESRFMANAYCPARR